LQFVQQLVQFEKRRFSHLGDKDKDKAISVGKIVLGHYSLERMAKEIEGLFEKHQYKTLKTAINQPLGQLVIRNFGSRAKPIEFDRNLANMFGIGRKFPAYSFTFVKKLGSPATHFIH